MHSVPSHLSVHAFACQHTYGPDIRSYEYTALGLLRECFDLWSYCQGESRVRYHRYDQRNSFRILMEYGHIDPPQCLAPFMAHRPLTISITLRNYFKYWSTMGDFRSSGASTNINRVIFTWDILFTGDFTSRPSKGCEIFRLEKHHWE